MNTKSLNVVSMLTSSDKITLFLADGQMMQIMNDNTDYDCTKIITYLAPLIKGTNIVKLDLSNFSKLSNILNTIQLEEQGVFITYTIGDKEFRGIFYPEKVSVTVKLPDGEKIEIPDVSNMTAHMIRAKEEDSPSVANFFRRLAPIMKQRRHSAEDLMKFIKRSEMPLTNDGRIICYKRVNYSETRKNYVDCHTGLVPQNIGTRVSMDVELVDPNRHTSCSQGLHVANLGYMRNFNGSHTLIVLVNPEDFIAVPHGEDTKARVSVYDIVGILNPKSHDVTSTGTHISNDDELKQLIQQLIIGNVIPMTKFVKVGKYGAIIEQGDLNTVPPNLSTPVNTSLPKGTSLMEDNQLSETKKTDLLKVAKKEVSSLEPSKEMPVEVATAFKMLFSKKNKMQVASALNTSTRSINRWMEKWDYEGYIRTLIDFSKPELPDESNEVSQEDLKATEEFHDKIIAKSKPSLFDLYVEIPQEKIDLGIKLIRKIRGMSLKAAKDLIESNRPVLTKGTEGIMNDYSKYFNNEGFVTKIVPNGSQKSIVELAVETMTKAKRARRLYNDFVLSGFSETALQRLLAFKKESKKGWMALGLTIHEIGRIENAS